MKLSLKDKAKIQQQKQDSEFETHIINSECKHTYYRVIKNKFNKEGRRAFECRNCGIIF